MLFKSVKKIIKYVFNKTGFDIVNLNRSPDAYFYRPKEIFFHPALRKAREMIYNDCPSPMYRETYHLHQIGSWGPLPAIISLFYEQNKAKGVLESLDIGCAFGTMPAFMSNLGFKASAIDFVPIEKYLGEKTRKTYNIDFHQIFIETENLPWSNEKFDLVTMTEVLEHFHFQPLDVLRKINITMKKGGLLLLTTPALGKHWEAEYYDCPFENIPSYKKGEPYDSTDKHWKIYDATELERLLVKAGFKPFVGLNLNINTGKEGLYAIAIKQ